jgi:hypothetical protein
MLTVKLVDGVLSILVDGKYPVYQGMDAFEVYDNLEKIEFLGEGEAYVFQVKLHINNMLL